MTFVTSSTDSTHAVAPRSKLTARDWRVLDSTFSIDTRALSVVRMLLAGLLVYQSLVLELGVPSELDGLNGFVARYAHIALVPFAVMMLVGYRTRVAVIACWLLYSIPMRGDLMAGIQVPMGAYVLNLGLFWCMFLPLGRHLSWDARQRTDPPVRYLSVATAALLFQIFIIYFSAGLYKDIGEWVVNATAMESILSHPNYMTSLGTALLDYPAVLVFASVATFVVEVVGALLVILPGKSLPARRLILVPVFLVFHVGIALFMGLGLFPYVMIALWLVFLPSGFWDRVWGRLGRGSSSAEPVVDRIRWRNGLAGAAVVIATISNLITWVSYPNFRNVEGVFGAFQDMATFLLLYQQWLMFNVPSMIPV